MLHGLGFEVSADVASEHVFFAIRLVFADIDRINEHNADWIFTFGAPPKSIGRGGLLDLRHGRRIGVWTMTIKRDHPQF